MSTYSLKLPQPAAHSLHRGFAVETRYMGPTDRLGSRISAVCRRDGETVFRAVVPYDHSLESLDAHYGAALEVLRKIEQTYSGFSYTFQSLASTERGYLFITQSHANVS